MNFREFSSSKDTILQIQLEYVRYGIEMQKGTQKALRNQQKTIAKRKNNIRNIGSKTIYKK